MPSQPRCLSCDYILTGLSDPRCPECGLPFDPANPKTFHTGKPISKPIRLLLQPPGWLYPFLALATLLILASCGIPRHWVKPQLVDAAWYPTNIDSVARWTPLHPNIKLFLISLAATALLIILWLFRWIIRIILSARYGHRPYARFRQLPQITFALFLALILALVFFGWAQRMAYTLVVSNTKPSVPSYFTEWHLEAGQRREIIRTALLDLPDPKDRIAALGLALPSIRYGLYSAPHDLVPEAIQRERDPSVLSAQLHYLCLKRDLNDAPLFVSFLTHPNPDIRAAAIDALGFLHSSGYLPVEGTVELNTDPPITANVRYFGLFPLPPARRALLQNLMLSAPTLQEREAAARALVDFPPPDYKLRYAEWGVWIVESGKLKLPQSVIDEIPPFVHRTGDPVRSIVNPATTTIAKPVIHLTASEPMSVDLDVRILAGRPAFAYPLPDDYVLDVAGTSRTPTTQPLAQSDPAVPQPLPNRRKGYPWITGHLTSGPSNPFILQNVGLRWQSLIVSPTQLPWMTPPQVPSDPKFQWWSSLRKVNSSWISSRGESERFLYYDGPTLLPAPVQATLGSRKLEFHFDRSKDQPPGLPNLPWHSLLIRVRNNHPSAWSLTLPSQPSGLIPIPPTPTAQGPAAPDLLLQLLQNAGLHPDEAQGLLNAWPHFFHSPGQRLLVLLPQSYYDYLCPLQIRPKPTQTARVGILLFELGAED